MSLYFDPLAVPRLHPWMTWVEAHINKLRLWRYQQPKILDELKEQWKREVLIDLLLEMQRAGATQKKSLKQLKDELKQELKQELKEEITQELLCDIAENIKKQSVSSDCNAKVKSQSSNTTDMVQLLSQSLQLFSKQQQQLDELLKNTKTNHITTIPIIPIIHSVTPNKFVEVEDVTTIIEEKQDDDFEVVIH